MEDIQTFDPVLFSNAENQFLLEHLGDIPIVARRAVTAPVNPRAVMPIIERVDELKRLEAVDGSKWVGIEPIKAAIKKWFEQSARWAYDNKRNKKAPRWPSLSSFDGRGKAHRSGPGSDSGRVRTWFGPAGERIPFEVQLLPDNVAPWEAPPNTEQSASPGLFVDSQSNRVECRVKVGDGYCGHTESYRAESRASYSAARARMSKHLRKATVETEAHRALHTEEFGQ
jgi:hypothetical protein